jgi:hypothetical protein
VAGPLAGIGVLFVDYGDDARFMKEVLRSLRLSRRWQTRGTSRRFDVIVTDFAMPDRDGMLLLLEHVNEMRRSISLDCDARLRRVASSTLRACTVRPQATEAG